MNIHDFRRKKLLGQKISFITCYDYPSACIVSESKIDCVLVGDSVAMVVHGHKNSLQADIDMMKLHTAAVARGIKNQFIVSDLPFLAHRHSNDKTIEHVKQLMQAGAHAIKIEGGDQDTLNTIQHLVTCGIPVMGHLGLTPQYFHQLGGYRVQGKEKSQAESILAQAKQLQKAGCFSLVLECIPQTLAKKITATIDIPIIGIGAGAGTDGQVLVWHDLLGLQTEFKPKFVKHFYQGKANLIQAINTYVQEVSDSHFPAIEHTYSEV